MLRDLAHLFRRPLSFSAFLQWRKVQTVRHRRLQLELLESRLAPAGQLATGRSEGLSCGAEEIQTPAVISTLMGS